MNARFKFRKYGVMKFVGHLDMMRLFQKILRRAKLPIAFSEGYSPHMIMSFAAPLGIALTSDAEYVDIALADGAEDSFDGSYYVEQMNRFVPDGVEVVTCVLLNDKAEAAMASVAAADYRITFQEPLSEWDTFWAQDTIKIIKKTKKNEKEIDIKPWVFQAELQDNATELCVRLAQGSSANLKPDLLLDAYQQFANLELKHYQIHRIEVYRINKKGNFIPLI